MKKKNLVIKCTECGTISNCNSNRECPCCGAICKGSFLKKKPYYINEFKLEKLMEYEKEHGYVILNAPPK